MPQRNAPSRRKRRSPYLFILLSVVLLIVLALVGVRTLNAWNLYEAEAAITPTPSPTARAMTVTPDPNFVTHTPPPTALPSPTPGYLSTGSQGQMVTDLQNRLQQLGYYSGKIDGDYGSGTKAAVEIFQKINGLDADGIAGQKTLAALFASDAKEKPGPVDTLAGNIPLLVNKWNPLPDGFEPADLIAVKDVAGDVLLYENNNIQAVKEAAEALVRMIQDAKNEGYTPWKLREAYRTVADQKKIFNNRINKYMQENELSRADATARTRREVADPGASEHHTGLAFDLNVPGESFGDTAQYLWLKKHCWDYGFIMRYTDEKDEITGITGEEWHVRYVGVEHAQKMRDLDYCLEEYVEYLKQQ